MKVFISWSGVRSKAVAQKLHDWLPGVMNLVEPWMSTEDMRKGSLWRFTLAEELESTHVGVICLTPENLSAPWLLFEAGALSKLYREKDAHVCTYLIDMRVTDVIEGPFRDFQHTLATEEETYRMVRSINTALQEGHGRRTDAQLKRAFELWWPELEQCLENLPEPQEPIPPPRTAEDMLREILEGVRDLRHSRGGVRPTGSVNIVDDNIRVTLPPQYHYRLKLQGSSEQIRQFASILGRRGGNITIQVHGFGEGTTESSQQFVAVFATGVDLRPDDVSRAATEAGLILLSIDPGKF
jgi:hypothetical protein